MPQEEENISRDFNEELFVYYKSILNNQRDWITRQNRWITRLYDSITGRNEVIANQKDIIASQEEIIANQEEIIANQKDIIAKQNEKIAKLTLFAISTALIGFSAGVMCTLFINSEAIKLVMVILSSVAAITLPLLS